MLLSEIISVNRKKTPVRYFELYRLISETDSLLFTCIFQYFFKIVSQLAVAVPADSLPTLGDKANMHVMCMGTISSSTYHSFMNRILLNKMYYLYHSALHISMASWLQNCSNSSAKALELLQSCTEPSIYNLIAMHWIVLTASAAVATSCGMLDSICGLCL